MDSDKVLEFIQVWGPWILAVVFAVVAWVVKAKAGQDGWREVVAILLGDIIANVLQAAHGQVDQVTEQMVRDAAAATYDRLTDLLPQKWHDLVVSIVDRQQFQAWAWQAWLNWRATLDEYPQKRALPE